jgi:dGTPase
VLYCSAFRRLAGVTQVTAVYEQHVLHNRLTHSLKVGQVGRRMAEYVLRNHPELDERADLIPDVVETAGLAHDIGHAPFGHIAEDVLDRLVADRCGGFEGNAQTFRVLTKLSVLGTDERDDLRPGLDLTRASLTAVLKYPRLRPTRCEQVAPWTDRARGAKWGAYRTEADDLSWSRGWPLDDRGWLVGDDQLRSANAVLMDWADDVSFATHDIEDYIRAGLFSITELANEHADIEAYARQRLAAQPGFDPAAFSSALGTAIDTWSAIGPYDGGRYARARLRDATSALIDRFVHSIAVTDEPPYVVVDPQAQYEVECLKSLTWFFVIERPSVATVRHGQTQLVEELFETLYTFLSRWVRHRSPGRSVPVALRDLYEQSVAESPAPPGVAESEDHLLTRAVCDYICTLTDEQTFDLFQRLTGTSRASVFGTWFQ